MKGILRDNVLEIKNLKKIYHTKDGETLAVENFSFNLKDGSKIGYMLQQDSLFEWRNILNNCLLGLEINKNLNNETKEQVINLLNTYGLKDFIYSYPDNLSGGIC